MKMNQSLEDYIKLSISLPTELKQIILHYSLINFPYVIKNHKLFTKEFLQFVPGDIEVNIGRYSFAVDSVYTGFVRFSFTLIKEFTGFLIGLGISQLNISHDSCPGEWSILLKFSKRVRLINFDSRNQKLNSLIENKVDSITDYPGERIVFLSNYDGLSRFRKLDYISLRIESYHKSTSQILSLAKRVKTLSLEYTGLYPLTLSDFSDFSTLASNIDFKIAVIRSNFSGNDTELLTVEEFNFLKNKKIGSLEIFNDYEPVKLLSEAKNVRKLKVINNLSLFQGLIPKNDNLKELEIHSKGIQNCDFSKLPALRHAEFSDIDTQSFNTLPGNVTSIKLYNFSFISDDAMFKLPRSLICFEGGAVDLVSHLDPSNCFQLRRLVLDFKALNTSFDYRFWHCLPGTITDINIYFRFVDNVDLTHYFTILMNENFENVTLLFENFSSVLVFVTSKTLRSEKDYSSYNNILRTFNGPYGFVCNISPKILFSCRPNQSITFVCSEEEETYFFSLTARVNKPFSRYERNDGFVCYRPYCDPKE